MTRKKSLRAFIREHRPEIDAAIRQQLPDTKIDDEERRLWMLNDEYLYNLALRQGVDL